MRFCYAYKLIWCSADDGHAARLLQSELIVLQTSKNSELAGVLIKFEERVKQRDERLEEAAVTEATLRSEIDHRDSVN